MTDISDTINNLDDIKMPDAYYCNPYEVDSMVQTKALNVLSQNIRSVRCNFNNFNTLLSQIKVELDVIILTECWLVSAPLIPILDDYHSCSMSDSYNQSDGVIAYVRNGIICDVSEILTLILLTTRTTTNPRNT